MANWCVYSLRPICHRKLIRMQIYLFPIKEYITIAKLGIDISLSNVIFPVPPQKARGCLLRAESEEGKCMLTFRTRALSSKGLVCTLQQRDMPLATLLDQNLTREANIQIYLVFSFLVSRVTASSVHIMLLPPQKRTTHTSRVQHTQESSRPISVLLSCEGSQVLLSQSHSHSPS